jgi:hypothetical protein
MTRRRFRLLTMIAAVAILILASVLLFLLQAAAPPPSALALRVQPDSFPVGTVLQNSRVEMSLGIFSRRKPPPMPAFVSGLPPWLKSAAEWSVWQFRDAAARMHMHVRVETPDFVELEETQVAAHSTQGPFVIISFRIKTERPGDPHGNLIVHLTGSAIGWTNVIVPLNVKVVSSTVPNSPAVLIVESPYECYSTGDGRNFEPLAVLNSRLAARGVRVDFFRRLPPSSLNYNTILLAGTELVNLDQAGEDQLRKFVAGGGRLILAANYFYRGTVASANRLLGTCGIQINDIDVRGATNLPVVPDLLTSGVTNVDFSRPSPISVTDAAQGRLLVRTTDGLSGYVAVSRQPGRGDVMVLAQSLWWNWIRTDPAKADNLKLLENLLAPPGT